MDEATKLAVAIGVLGFGFLLLTAITIDRSWKWGLAAATGLIAAILIDVHLQRADWLIFLRDMGIGAAGALAIFALLTGIAFLIGKTGWRVDAGQLRAILTLRRWQVDGAQPSTIVAPLSDRDLARRWFVVIAAALGSVVATLMGYGDFWQELLSSMQPTRVLAAALVVAVAVVLVGPMQEFVVGRSLAGAGSRELPGESFASLFTRKRSLRSALRLFLVFALALTLLELINNSLDQAIVSAGSRASFTFLLGSIAPAMVTAYWAVALQRDLPRRKIAKASMWASITFFAVLLYVPGLAMGLVLALLDFNSGDANSVRNGFLMLVASPFIGAAIAAFIGFLAAGVYAALGGLVLDYLRGWVAMAALLGALLLAAVVNQLGAVAYIWLLADITDWSTFSDLLLSAVGWWVGLLASGFPKIISGYRAPT